eukprot:m.383360 g.383360  ORF g.383360 m.383360 type:complete len:51 (-) comp125480_c0_seq1:67-219(-)
MEQRLLDARVTVILGMFHRAKVCTRTGGALQKAGWLNGNWQVEWYATCVI